jgi:hypothetical protein
MSRKGFELQFNWIFILIAGAVILAFFFSIVQNQRALSETKLSSTLLSQMDAVFTMAIENKGGTEPLVTPKPGIAFSCPDTCVCNFYIGKIPNSFGDKIIFAPALIKEQDSRAWAVEWKMPFRVANFLMLSSPETKYYFVYDSDKPYSAQLFQKINKAVPPEIVREIVSSPSLVSSIMPGGYEHTRFVFIGTEIPGLYMDSLNFAFAEEDVSGVWIDQDARQAVFYEKHDADELGFDQYPSLLAGDATAYAAIFASDHFMYNCGIRSAFEKLSVVAGVHAKRAEALKNAAESADPPRLDCSGAYSQIIPYLADVSAKALLLGTSFPEANTADEAGALGSVLGAQSLLQQGNQNLILQSCTEIY